MSANVELIKAWYDGFDFDTYLAEDVDFEVMEGYPDGGKYKGRAAVAAMFERHMARFSDFQAEIEEIIDGGHAVTDVGIYRGTLQANGAAFAIPFCHIWYIEDGRIKSMRHFVNTALMRDTSAR